MNQLAQFQPVYCRGYGTAGQQDLFADCIHRLRAFVEKRLQYSEIGEAEMQTGYAGQRVLFDRARGLPQNQPHMRGA